MCLYFFFFKQKTAYEMRINDWSSDVCSSDLGHQHARQGQGDRGPLARLRAADLVPEPRKSGRGRGDRCPHRSGAQSISRSLAPLLCAEGTRSEEHTSELQSLMRISYAVFCLTKKNNTITSIQTPHNSN